jgi:ADP-ribose pyrophosphatase
VNPNPALFDNQVHTFVARGVRKLGEIENEETEDTRVVLLPRSQLRTALRRRQIDHALVVAAFLWFLLEGGA